MSGEVWQTVMLGRLAAAALALGLATTVVACTDTGGGYTVLGLNESSQDVYVAAGYGEALERLASGTWDTLFVSFGSPDAEVAIYDETCRVIATLPWDRPDVTVHVRPDGSVELMDNGGVAPSGLDTNRDERWTRRRAATGVLTIGNPLFTTTLTRDAAIQLVTFRTLCDVSGAFSQRLPLGMALQREAPARHVTR